MPIDVHNIRDRADPPAFAATTGQRSDDVNGAGRATLTIHRNAFAFGGIPTNWVGHVTFDVVDDSGARESGDAAVSSWQLNGQHYVLTLGR